MILCSSGRKAGREAQMMDTCVSTVDHRAAPTLVSGGGQHLVEERESSHTRNVRRVRDADQTLQSSNANATHASSCQRCSHEHVNTHKNPKAKTISKPSFCFLGR